MKHIFLNLKRFDIPVELGGVNRLAPIPEWAGAIVNASRDGLREFAGKAEFVQYFPEAHILPAIAALGTAAAPRIGCQGVYRASTAPGGNFGAFTTNRPASAAKALGCTDVIIGHCEERMDKAGVLREADCVDADAINRILNQEIRLACEAGLTVLYCIGETADEQEQWEKVLGAQLDIGLDTIDTHNIVIAYEPVWSIGPGKTPAGRDYIEKIARFVKQRTNGLDVVYGGGLKKDNAQMLASIPEIDGGLIALTRFSGDIGFYPDEYIEIIRTYLNA